MDEIPSQPSQSTIETIETRKPSRWRMVAATATGSVALLGVATGIGYAAGGSTAGASSADATTTTAPATSTPRQNVKQRETDRLNKLLQPLVDKGTITSAQRDAVVAALSAGGPKAGGFAGGAGRGPGRMAAGFIGLFGKDAQVAADAIGVTTADLKTALMSGQSLAAIATAHNVAPQKVIDALVAATKAELAAHPRPNGATGPTDAQITQQITNLVNGTLPKFGGGFRQGGPGGFGGPGGPGGPGQPSAPGGPTTTAPAPPTTVAPTTTVPPTTTEPATTTTTS